MVTYPVADLVTVVGDEVPVLLHDSEGKNRNPNKTREEALIELITANVEPDTWGTPSDSHDRRKGGRIQFTPLGLELVVKQKRGIHEDIEDLLAAVRRLQERTKQEHEEKTKVYYFQFRALKAQRHGEPEVLSPSEIVASVLGQYVTMMPLKNYPIPAETIDWGATFKARLVKLPDGQLRLELDYHYSQVDRSDNGGVNIPSVGL